MNDTLPCPGRRNMAYEQNFSLHGGSMLRRLLFSFNSPLLFQYSLKYVKCRTCPLCVAASPGTDVGGHYFLQEGRIHRVISMAVVSKTIRDGCHGQFWIHSRIQQSRAMQTLIRAAKCSNIVIPISTVAERPKYQAFRGGQG
jgi:hypothetical protein